jgi:acetylornithine deacetylase/succinyl-diaminopimelate desuccinylase-like protein
MDKGVCDALREAGKKLGLKLPDVASGALHDAAILAPVIPTAMLFVASENGVSHNPKEFSRIEDIALAAKILAAAVT